LASKKSLNSTNWRHDLRPDRVVILRKGKKACFDPPIEVYPRRIPTENLGRDRGEGVCPLLELREEGVRVNNGDFPKCGYVVI